MRLDKFLAHTGFGTRKETKKLLKSGKVQVNGQIIKDGKHHVDPVHDQVQYLGETILYKEFIYIMLNKPPSTSYLLFRTFWSKNIQRQAVYLKERRKDLP